MNDSFLRWKITNIRCSIIFYLFFTEHRIVERKDNQLLRDKFGDGIPDVRDLAKNIRLLLVNQHFSMSLSRPLSPQTIEVGGVHILPAKEIPTVGFNSFALKYVFRKDINICRNSKIFSTMHRLVLFFLVGDHI